MGEQDIGPVGDVFESFLEEQGIRDEVYGAAIKRVLAWQFEEARKAANLGKIDLARAAYRHAADTGEQIKPVRVTDPHYAGRTVAELARDNLASLPPEAP